MRRLIYILVVFILIGGIILTAYAPDDVSTVFIVLMEVIVFVGVVLGVFPVLQFYHAFEVGLENIERALEVQTSSQKTSSRHYNNTTTAVCLIV